MRVPIVVSRTILALALTTGIPLRAIAAPILDQSFGTPPAIHFAGFMADFRFDIAQTFTVGLGGLFTGVEVAVGRTADDPVQPLLVEIRNTTAGLPDAGAGSVLASGSIAAVAIPTIGGTTTAGPWDLSQFAFLSVDLSSSGLLVSPGDVLALTLRSEAVPGGYAWAMAVPGGYVGGHGHVRANNPGNTPFAVGGGDQFFRTYVDPAAVPEPATLMLVAIGGFGLAVRKRRQ